MNSFYEINTLDQDRSSAIKLENSSSIIPKIKQQWLIENKLDDRIIPCNINGRNEKGKKICEFPYSHNTIDIDKLPNCNSVALKTGGGLLVIDIDSKVNINSKLQTYIGKTFTQETTNGYHLYFFSNEVYGSSTDKSSFIDIRSEGGVIFFHTNDKGSSYEMIKNTSRNILELPEELKQFVKKQNKYSDDATWLDRKSTLTADEIIDILKENNQWKYSYYLERAQDKSSSGVIFTFLHNLAYWANGEFKIIEEVFNLHEDFREKQKLRSAKLINEVSKVVHSKIEKGSAFYGSKSLTKEYYRYLDKYFLITKDMHLEISKEKALADYCSKLNMEYDKNKTPEVLTSINESIDYLADRSKEWKCENYELNIITNPTKLWDLTLEVDQEIIDDYKKVLNNKLDDLIEIVCLSIKFKENKKNKMLIYGGSNKGKTELADIFGFIEIGNDEFQNYFGSNQKNISKETAYSLQKIGLLHADDIKKLPANIKNLKDIARASIIYEGTKTLPLKFLLMSSTHSSILDGANDEIANRILIMNLGNDDYNILKSKIAAKDREKYKLHTQTYIRKKIVEFLNNPFVERERLVKLQEKYKLDIENNYRSEVIEETIEKIKIEYFYPGDRDNIIIYNNDIFIKNKKKLKQKIIDSLQEVTGKIYIANSPQATKTIMEYFVNENRTSKSINGETINLYQIQNVDVNKVFHKIDGL